MEFAPHLGLYVGVVVVLQEQGRGLGVVLAGGDVQGRQSHLALGIVLQQQGDHLVMALLESHRQRGEAILHTGKCCQCGGMDEQRRDIKEGRCECLKDEGVFERDASPVICCNNLFFFFFTLMSVNLLKVRASSLSINWFRNRLWHFFPSNMGKSKLLHKSLDA